MAGMAWAMYNIDGLIKLFHKLLAVMEDYSLLKYDAIYNNQTHTHTIRC